MSKFDKYLLSQLLAIFGFFSLSIIGIYWINLSVSLFEQVVGSGNTLGLFLELSFLSLPNLTATVLPIAAFIGTIYVINRFVRESELLVMQSIGMSAFQIARPVMIFGTTVMVISLFLMNALAPYAERVKIERFEYMTQTATSKLLTVGRFIHPKQNQTLYIREISFDGELHDVFLNDHTNPAQTVTYSSKKALFIRSNTGPKLVMLDGLAQDFNHTTSVLGVTKFESFTFEFEGNKSGRIEVRTAEPAELSTASLLFTTKETSNTMGYRMGPLLFEGHNRIAQPMQSLTVAMLALAAMMVGGFTRFSLWRQIALAVGIMFLLHFINTTSMGLVRNNAFLWPLTYASNIVGISVSLMLYLWVNRTRRLPRRNQILDRTA